MVVLSVGCLHPGHWSWGHLCVDWKRSHSAGEEGSYEECHGTSSYLGEGVSLKGVSSRGVSLRECYVVGHFVAR